MKLNIAAIFCMAICLHHRMHADDAMESEKTTQVIPASQPSWLNFMNKVTPQVDRPEETIDVTQNTSAPKVDAVMLNPTADNKITFNTTTVDAQNTTAANHNDDDDGEFVEIDVHEPSVVTPDTKLPAALGNDSSIRTTIINMFFNKLPTKAQLKAIIPNMLRTINQSLFMPITNKQEESINADLQQYVDSTMPKKPTLFHIQQLIQRAIDSIRNLILPANKKMITTLNADGSYQTQTFDQDGLPIIIKYDKNGKKLGTVNVEKPVITRQPQQFAPDSSTFNYNPDANPMVTINPNADNGDIVTDNQPQSNAQQSTGKNQPADKIVAKNLTIYNDMHQIESNDTDNAAPDENNGNNNPLTSFLISNNQEQYATPSSPQPLKKTYAIMDLTKPASSHNDAPIDLTNSSGNDEEPIDLTTKKNSTTPTIPTNSVAAMRMHFNDEGAFVDEQENPLQLEKYVRDTKDNLVPASSVEQQQAKTTIRNWLSNNMTGKKSLTATAKKAPYTTVKNKNGTQTTTWPIDNNGYVKTVVKNGKKGASESLENPSTSQQTITNYQLYDLNNPDANNQPHNILSSITHDNDSMKYTIYNTDGSWDSYTLYLDTYFDEATYKTYNKGDIEYQSSQSDQEPLYVKKNTSNSYKNLSDKAHTVANTVIKQIVQS